MKVPIVNENDEIIGYKDRSDLNSQDINRVSALWLSDNEGNILLAQRALDKKYDPGKWGPTVAGTVEEGETYETNIIKETEEEIGLHNIKPILGSKIRRSTNHEYFVQWFTITVDHNYPFRKQDSEVEEIRWFSKEEIIGLLNEKPEMFLNNFNQYIELFYYENQN